MVFDLSEIVAWIRNDLGRYFLCNSYLSKIASNNPKYQHPDPTGHYYRSIPEVALCLISSMASSCTTAWLTSHFSKSCRLGLQLGLLVEPEEVETAPSQPLWACFLSEPAWSTMVNWPASFPTCEPCFSQTRNLVNSLVSSCSRATCWFETRAWFAPAAAA